MMTHHSRPLNDMTLEEIQKGLEEDRVREWWGGITAKTPQNVKIAVLEHYARHRGDQGCKRMFEGVWREHAYHQRSDGLNAFTHAFTHHLPQKHRCAWWEDVLYVLKQYNMFEGLRWVVLSSPAQPFDLPRLSRQQIQFITPLEPLRPAILETWNCLSQTLTPHDVCAYMGFVADLRSISTSVQEAESIRTQLKRVASYWDPVIESQSPEWFKAMWDHLDKKRMSENALARLDVNDIDEHCPDLIAHIQKRCLHAQVNPHTPLQPSSPKRKF